MVWTRAIQDHAQTPFLALDSVRLRTNIATMSDRIAKRGGRGTPHLKTHKCVEIAELQRAHGATRATVATLAEGQLALRAGFKAILMAYPPVAPWRLDGLVQLAEQCHVTVTCSTPEHVDNLRATGANVDVYWEIDAGTGRLGTQPGRATAQAVGRTRFDPRVKLTGVMTFAGHAYAARGADELLAVRDEQDAALDSTVVALGSPALRKSVGVTPLARYDSDLGDEFRYGNYVFHDATQVSLGAADPDECALAVVTTVVDVPDERRVVVDAGAKSLPAEQMTVLTPGFGSVVGHPDLVVRKLFEEHGLCASDHPHGLRVGDRLAVVPNHACTAVNLYGRYSVFDGSGFVETWPIRARRQ